MELDSPVSESPTKISKFCAPTGFELKFHKTRLAARFPTMLNFRLCFIQHFHLESFFLLLKNIMVLAMLMTQLHIQTVKNVVIVLENIETKGKEVFS